MQKTSKKKRLSWTGGNLTKDHLAVHTDSNSHLSPSLHSEHSGTLSIASRIRGTHFIFGPVGALTALRLAQLETQTQIALQQLAILASVIVGNQYHSSDLAAVSPPHLALLSLLNRQRVSTVGLNSDTNSKNSTFIRPSLSSAMYYQHPQQQGSQPFANAPRPSQHQTPANQLPNASNMQGMGFRFPRPTQLPDELESALAIRGSRDMDHRQMDHLNQPGQASGSVIGQQGGCGSNPMSLTADKQPGHQQGVDWSGYQAPAKLFGNQAAQQQPQPRQSHGGGTGGGDGHGLYTPESAGSILASFGLSNEDLEVLSHYPDDQLTPDTLPFILRDIQINKSGTPKTVASTSTPTFSRNIHDVSVHPSGPSRSPEVPSLLTVTQTAGKVIDYGHASRGNDESTPRETFKREPLSSERTVKMYPASSLSTVQKVDKTESRDVQKEANKHGDRDYRRTSSEKRKRSRSPVKKFQSSPKSRNLDRDYRHDGSKARPSSASRNKASSRPALSSSGSRAHGSSRKFPTPTMISDFAAVPPKVYPHTCSLCHVQCDDEKDLVDHINTVNHTCACRDLRNKFPDWKPNLPSRSGRYGSRALWHPEDGSPFQSGSQSLARSPTPPRGKYQPDGRPRRPDGASYSPHRHPRPQPYPERSHRFESPLPRSHSPPYKPRAASSRDPRPERSSRESAGSLPGRGVKRPHDDSSKASASQPFPKSIKASAKPGTKTAKMAVKAPPPQKKKVVVIPAPHDRLVYLTGIPADASEQELTDLVGSFGKINNVTLMPCSEEESEKEQGQKASVCMMTAEGAQALASSESLSIRDQEITASAPMVTTCKRRHRKRRHRSHRAKHEFEELSDFRPGEEQDNSGDEAEKSTFQKGKVLITGLPKDGWSETDIVQLVQPFGTPSDVILAADVGKALVSLPDVETAQEMVKVTAFKPAQVNGAEVKVELVKQDVGLRLPVALYNLLMGSTALLESAAPVSWNSLLVIRNVPDTPSSSSQVLKLVRRFGTVIKTLALPGMVVCEMATPPMAFSVFKRFQTFPCIINHNPLFFCRKPDPKFRLQTKVIAACCDSPEVKPANGEDGQPAGAAEEERAAQEEQSSEPPLQDQDQDGGGAQGCVDTAGEESAGEKQSNVEEEQDNPDPSAAPSATVDSHPGTEISEAAAAAEPEPAEVKPAVGVSDGDGVPAGETKASDGDDAAAVPKLPKMTQAMVNALLVECRTRTASSTAAPPSGEQEEVAPEPGDKSTEKTKDTAKSPAQEEEGGKKQDRERTEREARREKERERRERERRAFEKERARREKERAEKARRERERREEERKEWEKREKERRERRRGHGEGHRSYQRSEGSRHGSWREDWSGLEEDSTKAQDDLEDFPFNMSDFVTLDEVGDVTDLPTVPTETCEEAGAPSAGQDAPSAGQDAPSAGQDAPSAGQDAPSAGQDAPSAGQDAPSAGQGAPSAGQDAPSAGQDAPSAGQDAPSAGQDAPSAGQDAPSAGQDAPSAGQDAPSSGQDAPQDVPLDAPEPLDATAPLDAPTPQEECDEQRSEPEGQSTAAAEDSSGSVEPDSTARLDPDAAASAAPASPGTALGTAPPPGINLEPDTAETTTRDSTPEDRPPSTPGPAASPDPPSGGGTAEREAEMKSLPTPASGEEVSEVSEVSQKLQEEENKDQTDADGDAGQLETMERCDESRMDSSTRTEQPLPPYDPHTAVGLEYLVPKTGFFCKVCSRFFSGAKLAEISHCKSLKHYEQLQKFLQTSDSSSAAVRVDST
ncbi:uncharacterized protein LOC133447198 isoform X2 [Cololabis saira]|uniref:uncharacterized protein LOC133447198 isoform X2 n=1 Tax=Cololabis saira TaxID=129043 RepID=UPI002AD3787D|nr:uncharacterized protein LOC133447198 isoform X2 [Cololabis saira]